MGKGSGVAEPDLPGGDWVANMPTANETSVVLVHLVEIVYATADTACLAIPGLGASHTDCFWFEQHLYRRLNLQWWL